MSLSIKEALAKIFEAGRGARIVSIVTETELKLLKKGRESKIPCPFTLGVRRKAKRNGFIGANYSNAVNNQREREGNLEPFNPEELWNGKGEHIPDNPYLVRHKDSGKEYLAFLPATKNSGIPIVSEDELQDIATGKILDAEELKEFMPAQSTPNQGTDNQIFWRTISLDNITEIKCGESYKIN